MGGAHHVVARLHGDPGEPGRLGEVRSDEGGEREDQAAERADGVLLEQPVPVLRDEDRVDHEHVDPRLAHRPGHGLDDRRVREHPRLRRVHADVGRHRADLLGDRRRRQRLEPLDASRVLDGHRGDRRHTEHAERGERLEVRLDPGAAAGVAPGDRQHPRAPWPTHAKWSQPTRSSGRLTPVASTASSPASVIVPIAVSGTPNTSRSSVAASATAASAGMVTTSS